MMTRLKAGIAVLTGELWGYPLLVGGCVWSILIQFEYPILGSPLPALFPAVGITLVLLKGVLLLKHFLGDDPVHPAVKTGLQNVGALCTFVLWGFVVCGVLVYINAKFDDERPFQVHSTLTTLSELHVRHGIPLSLAWTSLQSWHDPQHTSPLLLNAGLRRGRWGGEAVIVQMRGGFLAWPWVDWMERDTEHYARAILKANPNAQRGWQTLIQSYRSQNKLTESTTLVYEYLQHFPGDIRMAFSVGSDLVVAGFLKEGIPLLEYVVARRPVYGAYQSLGYALQNTKRLTEAAAILEQSVTLAPEDWEVYYHLGEIYLQMGHPDRSIAMYEEVLKRLPHFPEVESRVYTLRKEQEARSGK